MSYAYRSRVAEMGMKLLDCEEEEWRYIWAHIGDFCIASDQKVKEMFGETANEEEMLQKDKMSDEEFIAFAKETIRETLERLGYKGKKRKKKQIVDDDEVLEDNYNIFLQEQAISQRSANELKIDGGCPCHV